MAGSRRRVGVALLLDAPVAAEVEGLRRALGDGARERIAPHITLVPPLNLPAAALGDALGVLRSAAAGAPPSLRLRLGPVATFAPVNPVLYLEVGGTDAAALGALRTAVFTPPLHREGSWPWVPHVTVADDADPERIAAAVVALRSYSMPVEVDRIVLLELQEGKWSPLADATFGPPWRVGTGGFAVTLDRSTMVDPEAAAVLELPAGGAARGGAGRRAVITARADGRPVGVGAAWRASEEDYLAVWVPVGQRGYGVGRHVLAALGAATEGWGVSRWRTLGPRAFYRAVPGTRDQSNDTDA